MARHTQLKKTADSMSKSLLNLVATFEASGESRPFEALSLVVGAELIRTSSPMKLARAIEASRKVYEYILLGEVKES